ncbi:MAG: LysM peptidoglycan-binding domain-containing protein [Actinomycetota bacterium]|nr:LysM peptidoglycan-binding domain-containing protein [Actinomycetota bacterium]
MALRREDIYGGRDARIVAFPTAAVRARARAARRRYRLRRTIAGAAILLAMALVLGSSMARPDASPAPPAGGLEVTMQPSQTLWDLAERYAPEDTDLRAYVDEIESLNGLDGGPAAGQRLVLPAIP